MARYTIGIDYGTNSVRSIVVDCADGKEIGTFVFNYPTGEQGIVIDKRDHNLARQNPADYIEGLETSVCEAMKEAARHKGFSPDRVIGLGVDTTGSTPIPVDRNNKPLALDPKWKDNPAAHAWLWKDHTGAEESVRITELAKEHRPQYLAKCGNTYSSEWFWSKVWHCLRTSSDVFDAAYSWVECSDFVPAVLAGIADPLAVKRGVCAAGHKAMYCDEWNGLPDKEFLSLLDPKLADLRDRLYEKAYDAKTTAGALCPEWAKRLGLLEGIPIAIGAFDAHYGAVGSGVCEGTIVKIIGTSTCDCTVAPKTRSVPDIPGICGIVDGSILPDHYGIEAGQSAVGDIFHWFVHYVCESDGKLHAQLTDEAARLKPGQSGLLALDWNNGNRTILVDPRLTGLLLGQTLHTTRADIYRALIEATAYGARAIIERLREYGVASDNIVCCGGIAEKNPMLMQIYADVTGCTMRISGSAQSCALGSALAAAVAAGSAKGGYDSFADAQTKMTSVKRIEYVPIPENKKTYDRLYALYRSIHDAFGGVVASADLGRVMKDLIEIKEQQT
ncbi:ribulokinase [Candidatus Sumerlaeota bacterium]|nr:ribulokinase [Candidatus Sumerlaeota bacterium]